MIELIAKDYGHRFGENFSFAMKRRHFPVVLKSSLYYHFHLKSFLNIFKIVISWTSIKWIRWKLFYARDCQMLRIHLISKMVVVRQNNVFRMSAKKVPELCQRTRCCSLWKLRSILYQIQYNFLSHAELTINSENSEVKFLTIIWSSWLSAKSWAVFINGTNLGAIK